MINHGRTLLVNRDGETSAYGRQPGDEYLLLMRTIDDEFNETIDIEVNEHRIGDHNPIREAKLLGNTLSIFLNEPAKELDGASQNVLTYAETPENLASIEAGAFRVLGDALTGGNA